MDTNLSKASLTDAYLEGAYLEGAELSSANLRGAMWNDKTVFPEGFEIPDELWG